MQINKQQYLEHFKVEKKKVYEFQDLGSELQPIYGKGVWGLFTKVGVTENKVRDAHKICRERGITTLGYLIGVLKRL